MNSTCLNFVLHRCYSECCLTVDGYWFSWINSNCPKLKLLRQHFFCPNALAKAIRVFAVFIHTVLLNNRLCCIIIIYSIQYRLNNTL